MVLLVLTRTITVDDNDCKKAVCQTLFKPVYKAI